MDKYIFDESNGLWYELQDDYYIPCLILSEEETQPIGLWGQRHKQYLKEHKHFLYTTMLIEGTLNSYLADIDKQAQERLLLLTKQIAEQENVTEQPKPLFPHREKYPNGTKNLSTVFHPVLRSLWFA